MPSFTSIALFVLATAAVTAAGKEFEVGDAVGWRIPATNETELYNVWASRRRFHIGDSLRFRYNMDSVAKVNKSGFHHCDSSNPISFFNDGDTLVNLDASATFYFISGDSKRCHKGQRMIVNVRNLHHSPPTIADPPRNPYYDMSPSPSPSLGSGSGDSGAAGSVSPLNMVFVGAALVLALFYT